MEILSARLERDADANADEFVGVVTDIRLESRVDGVARWQMAIDGSRFRAGTTGALEAVARSGTRLVIPVLYVMVAEDGEIWHGVEKPLAAGTEVRGRVVDGLAGAI